MQKNLDRPRTIYEGFEGSRKVYKDIERTRRAFKNLGDCKGQERCKKAWKI